MAGRSFNLNDPARVQEPVEQAILAGRSLWDDARARLFRNKAAVASMVVLGLLVLVAAFGPMLWVHDHLQQSTRIKIPPTLENWHILGTDYLGRDAFARLLIALRISLLVGVVVTGAYVVQKWLLGRIVPPLPPSAGVAADLWVGLLVVLLAGTYWLLRYRSHWAPVQRLAIWLYAGCYLDEWATRVTLRLWPVRLPVRANPKRPPPTLDDNSREGSS